jgi:hypothetical protein
MEYRAGLELPPPQAVSNHAEQSDRTTGRGRLEKRGENGNGTDVSVGDSRAKSVNFDILPELTREIFAQGSVASAVQLRKLTMYLRSWPEISTVSSSGIRREEGNNYCSLAVALPRKRPGHGDQLAARPPSHRLRLLPESTLKQTLSRTLVMRNLVLALLMGVALPSNEKPDLGGRWHEAELNAQRSNSAPWSWRMTLRHKRSSAAVFELSAEFVPRLVGIM